MSLREQIKAKAKDMCKSNAGNLMIPLIFNAIVAGIVSAFTATGSKFGIEILTTLGSILGFGTLFLNVWSAAFYLKFVRSGDASMPGYFKTIKSGNHALNIFIANIVCSLIVICGTILLIIPGIIWGLKYSQVNNILADNPDMHWRDAMDRSKEITRGRNGEIFVMGLSFIGWILLSCLTAGILFLWTAPYMQTSFTLLYLGLCDGTDIVRGNHTTASGDFGADSNDEDGVVNGKIREDDAEQTIENEQEHNSQDDDIFNI